MAIMIAIVEIDKLGRLVVPKKVRDALHLRAGDKLDLEVDGERMTLAPKRAAKGLHMKDGWLVYDSGGPPLSQDTVNDWVRKSREERERRMMGLEDEG
jgi:AbrB family looped-hinge helix DNA binding protein